MKKVEAESSEMLQDEVGSRDVSSIFLLRDLLLTVTGKRAARVRSWSKEGQGPMMVCSMLT